MINGSVPQYIGYGRAATTVTPQIFLLAPLRQNVCRQDMTPMKESFKWHVLLPSVLVCSFAYPVTVLSASHGLRILHGHCSEGGNE